MSEIEKPEPDELIKTNESFQRILIEDVIRAIDAFETDQSQSIKREVIRTIFTAIEGSSWIYREGVRSSADSIMPLTPIQDFALAEKSYSVDAKGQIHEQLRFVPIPAMVRLTTSIAEQMRPDLKINFGVSGWADLQQAIKIRNRITHPKSISDLTVSNQDIEISQSGLFWLLGLMEYVLGELLSESKDYLTLMRDIALSLIDGDERTLAQYKAVMTAQID